VTLPAAHGPSKGPELHSLPWFFIVYSSVFVSDKPLPLVNCVYQCDKFPKSLVVTNASATLRYSTMEILAIAPPLLSGKGILIPKTQRAFALRTERLQVSTFENLCPETDSRYFRGCPSLEGAPPTANVKGRSQANHLRAPLAD
jgi:hypothetical protein